MRILWQPMKAMARCYACETLVEYDGWDTIGISVDKKMWDSKAGNYLYCPTCGNYMAYSPAESPPSIEQAAGRCQYCNRQLGEGDKFCNGCGAPL